MTRSKEIKAIIFAVLLGSVLMLAQSCKTTRRGCGCGADINRVYDRHMNR